MKKLLFMALMAFFSSSAFAQLMTSRMTTVKHNHTSKIWFDFGPGTYTGDVDDTGLGVDLGFRWTQMFGESIGWDILKISAQTDTKNFSECLDVQGKTGLRYVSPVLFGKQSLYANAAVGYGYYTDMEEGGLVWEIGAGVNVSPRFSVGIAYNSHNYTRDIYVYRKGTEEKSFNVGLVSLRLSIGL